MGLLDWIRGGGSGSAGETESQRRIREEAERWRATWPPESTWLTAPRFDGGYKFENYTWYFSPNGSVELELSSGDGSWSAGSGLISFSYRDPSLVGPGWECDGPIGSDALYLSCYNPNFFTSLFYWTFEFVKH